ncbi:MAG TPA: preprotein translocase subunit SecG [Vicinamibacterales bacterium]|jgi:preprotein translocase subunit SecG|nr:preprotein translocase subunit SecG [Vicinamibacterales bacterium]
MLYDVLLVLFIIVCILLLVVVLLQQGQGGDIAAAFGGSSSQTAFGARSGATVLTRATTVLGTLFLLGAFILTIMGRTGGGSVVSGVGGAAPASQQTAPALPMPALPAQNNGTAPANGTTAATPANGTSGSGSTSTPVTPAPQSSAPAGSTNTPAPAGK